MKSVTYLKAAFQGITIGVILTLSYLIGIGITSIILKLLGIKFWDIHPKRSTWVKPSGSGNLKKMY